MLAVGDTVPTGWDGFEVALSHEVLYLLHDLDARATAIHHSLPPGGTYFAVMGVHAGSPGVADWHASNTQRLALESPAEVDLGFADPVAAEGQNLGVPAPASTEPGHLVGHDDLVAGLRHPHELEALSLARPGQHHSE
jgi:hypothetical protein